VATSVGSVILEERLQFSDTAEVFRGRQPGLGREVLVQKVRREVLQQPGVAAALQREARLGARVSHRHVVGVIDLFAMRGDHYLVLEDPGGTSLEEQLKQRGRPPRVVSLQIARCIAAALDALHGSGVVHAAVQPARVRVAAGGRVMLEGFKAARGIDEHDAPAAPASAYAAPEVTDLARVGAAADVYAWAALTSQLVYGSLPPDAPAATARLLPLGRLLQACLQPSPDARPRMTEVCERLARIAPAADSRAATRIAAWAAGAVEPTPRLALPRMPDLPRFQLPARPRIRVKFPDWVIPAIGAGAAVGLGAVLLASVFATRSPVAAPRVAPPAPVDAGLSAQPRAARLRVHAFPWAEVHVDGRPSFVTPRAAPIEIAPGRHEIELRHPRFGTSTRMIELAPGEQRTLRHVFDQTETP
jgi:serine/threonine-protein kinase